MPQDTSVILSPEECHLPICHKKVVYLVIIEKGGNNESVNKCFKNFPLGVNVTKTPNYDVE
jgi:hypothetical protein